MLRLRCFFSCTDDFDLTVEDGNILTEQARKVNDKFKINESKAMSIANKFFKSSTRSSSSFSVDYVIENKSNYSSDIYFHPTGCLFYTFGLKYFSVGKKLFLESLICENLWGGFVGSGQ